MKKISYKDAGVDVEAGYESVKLIKNAVKSTYTKGVMGDIGLFGGFFKPDFAKYKKPVLVSGTDGVGTKVKIAIDLGIHNTVGIDLVAMSVNDILCCGADPMFFLDYIGINKVEPEIVAQIVEGIADGCRQSECALIGGETAEMADIYEVGDYDLAGFAVGIVDQDEVIDGTKVAVGDKIVSLPSSGLHSNGYTLARKVLLTGDIEKEKEIMKLMLTPTKLYVKDIKDLKESGAQINAISNITGGGLQENVARILPEGMNAKITKGSWDVPEIFDIIFKTGKVEESEMYHAFNMGVGMAVIVKADDVSKIKNAIVIGEIVEGDQKVELI